MQELTIFFIFILTAFNLFLSLFVLKHPEFNTVKKMACFLLVWLVPILGLIWVYLMLKRKDDTNGDGLLSFSWFASGYGTNDSSDASDGGVD